MDEHVRFLGARVGAFALLSIVACIVSASAAAQSDPTRPPDAPVAADARSVVERSDLTSILISKTRLEAIIGGRIVRVGDRVGRAQVMKISESEVILRDENGLQILKLFPGIEKRFIVAGDGQTSGVGRDRKEKRTK